MGSGDLRELSPEDHWQEMLSVHYGVSGKIVRLVGEYDLNMKVMADGRALGVLKVMAPDCDAAIVDMQISALNHLRCGADRSLFLPFFTPARV